MIDCEKHDDSGRKFDESTIVRLSEGLRNRVNEIFTFLRNPVITIEMNLILINTEIKENKARIKTILEIKDINPLIKYLLIKNSWEKTVESIIYEVTKGAIIVWINKENIIKGLLEKRVKNREKSYKKAKNIIRKLSSEQKIQILNELESIWELIKTYNQEDSWIVWMYKNLKFLCSIKKTN